MTTATATTSTASTATITEGSVVRVLAILDTRTGKRNATSQYTGRIMHVVWLGGMENDRAALATSAGGEGLFEMNVRDLELV